MEKIKIEASENEVYVTCPKCGDWEAWDIDEPRKRFSTLVDWYPDIEGKNEVSIHKCKCGCEFEVEWDYENIIED